MRDDHGVKEETDSEFGDDDKPFDKFAKATDSGHTYHIDLGQKFVNM